MDVSVFLAFISGLASTLSPCVLPVLPTFLAWIGGVALSESHPRTDHRRALLSRLLLFSLALILLFTVSGLGAGALGSLGRGIRSQAWLLHAAGLVFIGWGALLLELVHLPPIRIAHHRLNDTSSGWLGALGFGVLFTVMWVPCVGPIYGSILTLAAASGTALRGALLLLSYSVGLALPFVVLGLFAGRLVGKMRGLARFGHLLRSVIGVLIVTLGILLVTGLFTRVAGWVVECFPLYVPPLA